MSHKKYRAESDCLNCGAEVIDKFCHRCGQENVDTRENFFHLVGHFISDYLHFDSKFFRSLIPLFSKPGFLTRQYWEGKRVRYIHPLRLFFFVTIIFMISTSYFYHRFGDQLKRAMVHSDNLGGKYDSAYIANATDSAKVEIKRQMETENRQVTKLHAGVDLVFTNLKYVTFFLLPVYAFVFKMLYLRRRKFYVDHLVYAMHLQTFVYCLFGLLLVLPFIFSIPLDLIRRIALVAIFIYIGFSLHYLYKQTWWKTLLKSIIATFSLFFLTMVVIVTIAAIDAIFIQ